MAQVVTLEDWSPPPRYDSVPWTQARIEEGTAAVGTFTTIDTIALSPIDTDPSQPASRSFTTQSASETPELWYRLVFLDATGDDTLPTLAVQNIPEREPYASVSELAALLRVRAADRHAALRRVLQTAATEIDDEIGSVDINGDTLPYGAPPPLVVEVNLERAVEHWQQMQSPFGIIGMGDMGATYTARDSWDRHAHKLSPLKGSWGIA